MEYDAVWMNGRIVTCEDDVADIEKGAIAVKDGKIAWLGEKDHLPKSSYGKIHDLAGRCLTPGFIDCHTHLIFAGNRAQEFELRLAGYSYQEIHDRGGGILSTVTATRAAGFDTLLELALTRAKSLMASGVTTLEIKSGYGLDLETEIKMLRVANALADHLPITIMRTFLGAHTVPPEFKGRTADYVRFVCEEMIPAIATQKLADAVDVFCENMAFSLEQTEEIFKTAKAYRLPIKCHAEQLSSMGASGLAARFQALSVDHLEHLPEATVVEIVKANTVAVLLPGAYYFLREKQLPPIAMLRKHQAMMAIASDCNPGTSPIASILVVMNLACVLFNLTPLEALLGVTGHAAQALGLQNQLGTLKVGKQADFAIWHIDHPRELSYFLGLNPLSQLVKKGEIIFDAP